MGDVSAGPLPDDPDEPVGVAEIVVHEGMDAVCAALDEGLADVVGSVRAELWRTPRAGYRPRLSVLSRAGEVSAVALTSGRPATAAATVSAPWASDDAAGADLVRALRAAAVARGDVALKWASPDPLPSFAIAAGFEPLRRPLGAVGTGATAGGILWLEHLAHREPGYYAQTTLFTCGAVAALMAAGLRGVDGFTADSHDRDLELGFWRLASNFPACEPVGLAVTTAEHLGTDAVEVSLDHDGPVLVEGYSGFDLSFRAELQAESLRRAEELGLTVTRTRVGVDEIARRVAGGELALLLIDEAPMHAEHGPHWVLAHASDGREFVVIEDPWINRESGETWVDTHELPVRLADLDRLVRWSDAGYRGVIFLGRGDAEGDAGASQSQSR